MKRSRINEVLLAADDYIRSFGFRLPPFAYLSPDEMKQRRSEFEGVIDAHLVEPALAIVGNVPTEAMFEYSGIVMSPQLFRRHICKGGERKSV